MSDQDFTITFAVDQTPEEAFAAIQNVRGWWSEGVEGRSDAVGDEFTYRHKDLHYSKQKLEELVPARRLVWRVLDADLSFAKDTAEWKGTELRFEIANNRNQTEVRFTHVGLVAACDCFEACSKGWTYYVGDSLRRLMTTGKGLPDQKECAKPTARASSSA
jgi:hypothetical protein